MKIPAERNYLTSLRGFFAEKSWFFYSPFSLQKSLAEFAPAGANKMEFVFPGDMRVGENTSRPANVRIVRLQRTMSAVQRAATLLSEKALPFSTVSNGIAAMARDTVFCRIRAAKNLCKMGKEKRLTSVMSTFFAGKAACDSSDGLWKTLWKLWNLCKCWVWKKLGSAEGRPGCKKYCKTGVKG